MLIIKPINKFKTYKFDSAPFFFFIDVLPVDYSNDRRPDLVSLINSIKTNPIMPLPMRIDRVFNGERSILIRPKEPISFSITEDLTAIVNPLPFLQLGFEKLLYFTEVRSQENFFLPLTSKRAIKWWQVTKNLYGNLQYLEGDFSAFLRAYMYTILKAKILEEDLVNAAQNYCQLVADVCRKRMEQNAVMAEVNGKQENVKMYKIKDVSYYKKFKKTRETQYRPELIDIEIFDLPQEGFPNVEEDRTNFLKRLDSKELKYIPLLFYDDLLECMLQNLKKLEDGSTELLDPSVLFKKNIIITQKTKGLENIKMQDYSWWNNFENIDLYPIIRSIIKNHQEYVFTLEVEEPQ